MDENGDQERIGEVERTAGIPTGVNPHGGERPIEGAARVDG